MTQFNFGDSYREAGLSPTGDVIVLREQAFSTLRAEMDKEKTIALTRIYFGLSVPQGTDWFRDAFAQTDPSFSMIQNKQEAAVLAACLLGDAIRNHEEFAALSVLAASAGGNRAPMVLPSLIETARSKILEIAVEQRTYETLAQMKPNILKKAVADDEFDAINQAPDWAKVIGAIKKVSDSGFETDKSLLKHLEKVLMPLVSKLDDLREEVSILWWHIGGCSRVLDIPFEQMEPPLAAVMAGLDLADLTQTLAGAAAAPAILQRTILQLKPGQLEPVSIQSAVNSFPSESLEKLGLSDDLRTLADICPVLAGFYKLKEVGDSPLWEAAFEKVSQIQATACFTLLEIAMQVYRERCLLTALD